MTINPETEVVATRTDWDRKSHFYTIERDGKRWTVEIPFTELDKHGYGPGNKLRRRTYLANALTNGMRNKPDAPTGATRNDPLQPATWDEFEAIPPKAWFINPADHSLQQKP